MRGLLSRCRRCPSTQLALVALLGGGAAGCSAEEQERLPPDNLECTEGCEGTRDVVGGAVGGEPKTGPEVVSDGGVSQVQGEVREVPGLDLDATSRLRETVTVGLAGVDDPSVEQRSSGEFTLTVPDEYPLWLSVLPEEDSSLQPTFFKLDQGSTPSIALLNRLTLSDLSEGLLVEPAPTDARHGHALLFFVDAAGTPLAGVGMRNAPGLVAFDLGVSYTNDAETRTTDLRGSVAIFNAPIGMEAAWLSVNVEHEGEVSPVRILMAPDTVSIATFEL